MKRILIAVALAAMTASSSLAAGLMQPKDSVLSPMQIRQHVVKVVINNGFAVTEVDQIFFNPHDRDLEAIYTFPLPKDASLSELSLWIDGQEVMGEVVEKERAAEIYRDERDAGRETALAEQREYHAFDVLVSPVRAGQETRVRLVYLQPLEIDTGVGRYVYALEDGEIDEEARTFWDVIPTVHDRFEFHCTLRSSYPVDAVRVTGYEELATVSQDAPDTWNVVLNNGEGAIDLNKDVVVYYRLAQDLPARVDMLAHRAGDEPGTFLLVITPGADLQSIAEGVDWSIVLDVSGSMSSKLTTASSALSRAMNTLRPQDRFRILLFSDGVRPLVPHWTPVTPGSVDEARSALAQVQTGGATNLHAGVRAGLKDLDEDRTSALVLISDGGANIGPTGHAAFLKLLERRDVRVFTFVMGQGANRPLLGRLASESGGFTMDISNQDDLYGRIVQAREKLGREALHGVKLEVDGVEVADMAPQRLPSAYHGQQITLFGRYVQPGDAKLRLQARISGQENVWETVVRLPEKDESHPELERLWALARIQDLERRMEDEGEGELRQAVVDLGTTYSIVTEHTSMLVVREERFEDLGLQRNNRDRVAGERLARLDRRQRTVTDTRADSQQPMFRGRSAPSRGGGGAVGPWFLLLLVALLGVRFLLTGMGQRP